MFLLILLLDIFNYRGGRWTGRLCKLNILVNAAQNPQPPAEARMVVGSTNE